MRAFICDKGTLVVLDKFLVGFLSANYFANKLVRWFVFEASQKNVQHMFYQV